LYKLYNKKSLAVDIFLQMHGIKENAKHNVDCKNDVSGKHTAAPTIIEVLEK